MSQQLNLDEKDRQILRFLLKTPKATVADIARDAGVQRDTVAYRLERFEKRGLIVKYHTIIEPQVLGLAVFMMLLVKVKPVAKERLDTFITLAQQHKNVTHMSRLIGNHDYLFQVATKDIADFDRVLDELKQAGEGIVDQIELSSIIDGLKTDDFTGLV